MVDLIDGLNVSSLIKRWDRGLGSNRMTLKNSKSLSNQAKILRHCLQQFFGPFFVKLDTLIFLDLLKLTPIRIQITDNFWKGQLSSQRKQCKSMHQITQLTVIKVTSLVWTLFKIRSDRLSIKIAKVTFLQTKQPKKHWAFLYGSFLQKQVNEAEDGRSG